MKKNQIKRENPYSYSKLSYLFNIKVQFILRDAPILKKYQITEFTDSELLSLAQMLRDMVQDSEMIVKLKDATNEKDELIGILFNYLKFLKSGMQNSFEKKELRSLVPTIFKLSTQKDWELVHSANAALRVAVTYGDKLAKWGVTPNFIARLQTQITACENIMYEIPNYKSERNQTTDYRVETANKVYKTMLRICNVGQLIWTWEQDKSKFNDYLLPSAKQLNSKLKAEESVDSAADTETQCPLLKIPTSPAAQNPAETVEDTKSESKA